MRIAYCCFVLAGFSGMSLGLYMGIAEDHSLSPAHAHLNLLGWVTMMLYGLYHRAAPQADAGLRWVQAGLGGAGLPAFAIGLGVYLKTANEVAFLSVIAGTLATLAGMLLFIVILVRDAGRQRLFQRDWQATRVLNA